MDLKQEYIDKIEEQLEKWKVEIKTFKTLAEKAEAEQQKEYFRNLHNLEQQQERAELKLAELKEASQESWEDIRVGYEKVRQEIAESISNIKVPS